MNFSSWQHALAIPNVHEDQGTLVAARFNQKSKPRMSCLMQMAIGSAPTRRIVSTKQATVVAAKLDHQNLLPPLKPPNSLPLLLGEQPLRDMKKTQKQPLKCAIATLVVLKKQGMSVDARAMQ
jgi:hypothetical protein